MRKKMRGTLLGFLILYLSHYLTLAPAEFHPELLSLLEDAAKKFLSIIGFRGSAKSSFASVALPLYLALERPEEYPFIIIVNETRDQAIENIANIRKELEANNHILRDYGDLSKGIAKQREWTKTGLLLNNGVRILGLSRGQRIRGRRHLQHRPSIVIVDDPEEIEKVQKIEYREKTERWLRGEVVPAIEETKARLIVLGNLLHTDAIMMRLKKDPIFEHHEYSLFKGGDDWQHCTWPAKYPDAAALDFQKRKVGPIAWLREYCIKLVPPEGQIIKPEWIRYYDDVPTATYDVHPETGKKVLIENPILSTGVGNDLAISKKQGADFTTFVGGVMALQEHVAKIFVLPHPVNMRLDFQETIRIAKGEYQKIMNVYGAPMFFVEQVAYQAAAVEMMQAAGIPADPVNVGSDKRARLMMAAIFIENGTVLFPRTGCEDLIAQLLGFGIEEHDDLVDALVYMILGINNASGMQPLDVIQIL